MRRLGMTGGIGMGKSVSGKLLQSLGVPVVDTDDIARQVVEPGTDGLSEIQARFGPEILNADGRLNRSALAQRVFAAPEERHALEAIVHPRIRRTWHRQLDDWAAEGHEVAAVIIPLLFETQSETALDVVACVVCSARAQRKRLQARGWSSEDAQRRLSAQWPIDTKIRHSAFAVWAEGNEDGLREQWIRVLERLRDYGGCQP